jgi:hypothetical protein
MDFLFWFEIGLFPKKVSSILFFMTRLQVLINNNEVNWMNIRNNQIIIVKHDQSKKGSGPADLKRKIGSLPA